MHPISLDPPPVQTRAVFGLIGLVSLGSVGAAVYAQHQWDMQPCPWCILQRILYLGIGIVALLAAALPDARDSGAASAGAASRFSRLLSALVMLVLGIAGGAAALYQNLVASKLPSCDMTLADKIISGLGLDAWQPEVFEVRSSCADAAVKIMGVPFELWSLLLFVAIVAAAVWLMRLTLRAGR